MELNWKNAGGHLPEGWTIVPLRDFLINEKSVSVGVMYPGEHHENGIPLIKVGDVNNGKITGIPTSKISPEVDEEYKRTRLNGDELLITLVGNPGEIVIVEPRMKGWNAARALAVLRLKDPNVRKWLNLVLNSKPIKHIIDSRLNTTVQKTLNLKDVKELPIPVPNGGISEASYRHYYDLDDKITLNRQINQTLEQMAQALFKSWFVDFDPVIDNALDAGFFEQDLAFPDELLRRAETRRAVREHSDFKPLPDTIRQLFPAAFEECAEPSLGIGGWVPQGWEATPLTTVANIVYGKNLPKSKITNQGYPVYGGNGVIGSYGKYLYKTPQVLISCRGAASGKVHWTQPFCFVTNNSLVIEEKDIDSLYVYYCLLQQDLTNLTSGSAQPQMTIANLNPVNILIPENELITKFVQHVQTIQTSCDARKIECKILSNLRDTLLPKLISGELSLDDVGLTTQQGTV